jgi:PKD repeat protein
MSLKKLAFLVPFVAISYQNIHAQTPGFSVSADTGCIPFNVTFSNLIPSNSNPGISYQWDFGNGDTSTLEQPQAVTYNNPGTYFVSYIAIFDTIGYSLDSVKITSSACNDDVAPFTTNAPDFYLNILNSASVQIFNNDPNTAPFVGTAPDDYPPVTFNTGLVNLQPQTYTIEVWDDDNDLIEPDDLCGTFTFVPNDSTLQLTDSICTVILYFTHIVDTVTYSDSIYADACLGITHSEFHLSNINVNPNPSTGLININVPAPGNYFVTDQTGRLIRTDMVKPGSLRYQIELEENGVYFVYGEYGVNPARIVITR